MTDFRARGTIMGPAGLTAVFGMGTGVAPPVWSPESGRGAMRPRRPRFDAAVGNRVAGEPVGLRSEGFAVARLSATRTPGWGSFVAGTHPDRDRRDPGLGTRRRVGVVKLLGC